MLPLVCSNGATQVSDRTNNESCSKVEGRARRAKWWYRRPVFGLLCTAFSYQRREVLHHTSRSLASSSSIAIRYLPRSPWTTVSHLFLLPDTKKIIPRHSIHVSSNVDTVSYKRATMEKAIYINANICSNDSGNLYLKTSKNEWIPWRHSRAGIEYLVAKRRNAGLAEGCWDVKRKSWCSKIN